MDINKVWLSGLVISRPVLTKVGNNETPLTSFNMQVNEKFKDRGGNDRIKPNIIRIESLGRSAEKAAEKVVQGQRFFIDGYVREDNRDGMSDVRVRTLGICEEDSDGAVQFRQGLKQALEILKKASSSDVAAKEIESLLSG